MPRRQGHQKPNGQRENWHSRRWRQRTGQIRERNKTLKRQRKEK